jgi:hypothetical protein
LKDILDKLNYTGKRNNFSDVKQYIEIFPNQNINEEENNEENNVIEEEPPNIESNPIVK